MALGDIQVFDEAAFGFPGSQPFDVEEGAVSSINSGEPVAIALGAVDGVTALATNKPVVGTDFMAGISTSTSTETVTVEGSVQVQKLASGVSYLIAPKDTTLWDTQAEYDALVGARVLFDKTSGVYTILAADGATNGLVVMPLNIAKYPGKVRFAIRNAVNFLA